MRTFTLSAVPEWKRDVSSQEKRVNGPSIAMKIAQDIKKNAQEARKVQEDLEEIKVKSCGIRVGLIVEVIETLQESALNLSEANQMVIYCVTMKIVGFQEKKKRGGVGERRSS